MWTTQASLETVVCRKPRILCGPWHGRLLAVIYGDNPLCPAQLPHPVASTRKAR